MANKELTEKTKLALTALNEVGGSATLAELKAAGYEVGSSNLTSLVNAGKVTVEKVEVEKVVVSTVNKYTVVAE